MLWLAFVPVLACERWAPLTALAPITAPGLEESSGVAPSLRTPGLLWTHDDAGAPELYRFGIDGTVTTHPVPAADNRDWEDIASASCGGRTCLYIGDIGAERGTPEELQVYVVVEPADEDDPASLRELWELRWPSTPRDAETLLVHPCTLDAFLVTRGEVSEVFAVASDRGPRATDLRPVAALSVPDITGGDFSPDGTALVLRTREAVYRWTVDPDDPEAVFSTEPVLVVDGLTPGEALTWEPDGDLILTSEGAPTAVGRLACDQPADAPVCTPTGCGCRTAPWSLGGGWAVVVAAAAARWAARRRRDRQPSAA
jgi:hypothetical protein